VLFEDGVSISKTCAASSVLIVAEEVSGLLAAMESSGLCVVPFAGEAGCDVVLFVAFKLD
jgi:hypothetical protein